LGLLSEQSIGEPKKTKFRRQRRLHSAGTAERTAPYSANIQLELTANQRRVRGIYSIGPDIARKREMFAPNWALQGVPHTLIDYLRRTRETGMALVPDCGSGLPSHDCEVRA
jgi:hypothetical protein